MSKDDNIAILEDALWAAGFTHVEVSWVSPISNYAKSVLSGAGGWEFTSDTRTDNLGMTIREALAKIRSYPPEVKR